MYSRAELQKFVYAGRDLLDLQKPGWREVVTVESLDLSSSCRCVLGQIWGHYNKGKDALMTDEEQDIYPGNWAVQHGFERPLKCVNGPSDSIKLYRILHELWEEVIENG